MTSEMYSNFISNITTNKDLKYFETFDFSEFGQIDHQLFDQIKNLLKDPDEESHISLKITKRIILKIFKDLDPILVKPFENECFNIILMIYRKIHILALLKHEQPLTEIMDILQEIVTGLTSTSYEQQFLILSAGIAYIVDEFTSSEDKSFCKIFLNVLMQPLTLTTKKVKKKLHHIYGIDLPRLIKIFKDSGDFELQSLIIEFLFQVRFTHAKESLHIWFPEPNLEEFRKAYAFNYKTDDFDIFVRKILNIFNQTNGEVLSIPCESVVLDNTKLTPPTSHTDHWVDFNLGTQTIHLAYNIGSFSRIDNDSWSYFTVTKKSIHRIYSKRWYQEGDCLGKKIIVRLCGPLENLNPQFRKYIGEPSYLLLYFKSSDLLEQLDPTVLTQMYGRLFKNNYLKRSSQASVDTTLSTSFNPSFNTQDSIRVSEENITLESQHDVSATPKIILKSPKLILKQQSDLATQSNQQDYLVGSYETTSQEPSQVVTASPKIVLRASKFIHKPQTDSSIGSKNDEATSQEPSPVFRTSPKIVLKPSKLIHKPQSDHGIRSTQNGWSRTSEVKMLAPLPDVSESKLNDTVNSENVAAISFDDTAISNQTCKSKEVVQVDAILQDYSSESTNETSTSVRPNSTLESQVLSNSFDKERISQNLVHVENVNAQNLELHDTLNLDNQENDILGNSPSKTNLLEVELQDKPKSLLLFPKNRRKLSLSLKWKNEGSKHQRVFRPNRDVQSRLKYSVVSNQKSKRKMVTKKNVLKIVDSDESETLDSPPIKKAKSIYVIPPDQNSSKIATPSSKKNVRTKIDSDEGDDPGTPPTKIAKSINMAPTDDREKVNFDEFGISQNGAINSIQNEELNPLSQELFNDTEDLNQEIEVTYVPHHSPNQLDNLKGVTNRSSDKKDQKEVLTKTKRLKPRKIFFSENKQTKSQDVLEVSQNQTITKEADANLTLQGLKISLENGGMQNGVIDGDLIDDVLSIHPQFDSPDLNVLNPLLEDLHKGPRDISYSPKRTQEDGLGNQTRDKKAQNKILTKTKRFKSLRTVSLKAQKVNVESNLASDEPKHNSEKAHTRNFNLESDDTELPITSNLETAEIFREVSRNQHENGDGFVKKDFGSKTILEDNANQNRSKKGRTTGRTVCLKAEKLNVEEPNHASDELIEQEPKLISEKISTRNSILEAVDTELPIIDASESPENIPDVMHDKDETGNGYIETVENLLDFGLKTISTDNANEVRAQKYTIKIFPKTKRSKTGRADSLVIEKLDVVDSLFVSHEVEKKSKSTEKLHTRNSILKAQEIELPIVSAAKTGNFLEVSVTQDGNTEEVQNSKNTPVKPIQDQKAQNKIFRRTKRLKKEKLVSLRAEQLNNEESKNVPEEVVHRPKSKSEKPITRNSSEPDENSIQVSQNHIELQDDNIEVKNLLDLGSKNTREDNTKQVKGEKAKKKTLTRTKLFRTGRKETEKIDGEQPALVPDEVLEEKAISLESHKKFVEVPQNQVETSDVNIKEVKNLLDDGSKNTPEEHLRKKPQNKISNERLTTGRMFSPRTDKNDTNGLSFVPDELREKPKRNSRNRVIRNSILKAEDTELPIFCVSPSKTFDDVCQKQIEAQDSILGAEDPELPILCVSPSKDVVEIPQNQIETRDENIEEMAFQNIDFGEDNYSSQELSMTDPDQSTKIEAIKRSHQEELTNSTNKLQSKKIRSKKLTKTRRLQVKRKAPTINENKRPKRKKFNKSFKRNSGREPENKQVSPVIFTVQKSNQNQVDTIEEPQMSVGDIVDTISNNFFEDAQNQQQIPLENPEGSSTNLTADDDTKVCQTGVNNSNKNDFGEDIEPLNDFSDNEFSPCTFYPLDEQNQEDNNISPETSQENELKKLKRSPSKETKNKSLEKTKEISSPLSCSTLISLVERTIVDPQMEDPVINEIANIPLNEIEKISSSCTLSRKNTEDGVSVDVNDLENVAVSYNILSTPEKNPEEIQDESGLEETQEQPKLDRLLNVICTLAETLDPQNQETVDESEVEDCGKGESQIITYHDDSSDYDVNLPPKSVPANISSSKYPVDRFAEIGRIPNSKSTLQPNPVRLDSSIDLSQQMQEIHSTPKQTLQDKSPLSSNIALPASPEPDSIFVGSLSNCSLAPTQKVLTQNETQNLNISIELDDENNLPATVPIPLSNLSQNLFPKRSDQVLPDLANMCSLEASSELPHNVSDKQSIRETSDSEQDDLSFDSLAKDTSSELAVPSNDVFKKPSSLRKYKSYTKNRKTIVSSGDESSDSFSSYRRRRIRSDDAESANVSKSETLFDSLVGKTCETPIRRKSLGKRKLFTLNTLDDLPKNVGSSDEYYLPPEPPSKTRETPSPILHEPRRHPIDLTYNPNITYSYRQTGFKNRVLSPIRTKKRHVYDPANIEDAVSVTGRLSAHIRIDPKVIVIKDTDDESSDPECSYLPLVIHTAPQKKKITRKQTPHKVKNNDNPKKRYEITTTYIRQKKFVTNDPGIEKCINESFFPNKMSTPLTSRKLVRSLYSRVERSSSETSDSGGYQLTVVAQIHASYQ